VIEKWLHKLKQLANDNGYLYDISRLKGDMIFSFIDDNQPIIDVAFNDQDTCLGYPREYENIDEFGRDFALSLLGMECE
jgi:hypothetical protein